MNPKKIGLTAIFLMVLIAGGYSWLQMRASSSGVAKLDVKGIEFSSQDGQTVVNFTTNEPGFCQVLLGTSPGKYDKVAVESMPEGAHKQHYNKIDGLKPNTKYVYRITLSTADGRLFQSEENNFQTTGDMMGRQQDNPDKPDGINIALPSNGAKVLGVSSNYGNAANNEAWGAQKAIDGDSATEWSSDGEGNKAWIEIGFDKTYSVKTIGFWTRTMKTSAEIKQFRVLNAAGQELGNFSLKGAEQIQYFSLQKPTATNSLRFEVTDSNGGNTGAVEIEVYAEK